MIQEVLEAFRYPLVQQGFKVEVTSGVTKADKIKIPDNAGPAKFGSGAGPGGSPDDTPTTKPPGIARGRASRCRSCSRFGLRGKLTALGGESDGGMMMPMAEHAI